MPTPRIRPRRSTKPSSPSQSLGLWLTLGSALALASCGEDAAPETTTGHLAAKLELGRAASADRLPSWKVVRATDNTWTEVRQTFVADQMAPSGIAGLFALNIPLTSRGQSGASEQDRVKLEIEGARLPALNSETVSANRLFQDGKELSFVAWYDGLDIASVLKPGSFATVAGVLYLMPFQAKGVQQFEFVAHFPTIRESNDAGGHQRVDLGAHAFHGVDLISGDEYTAEVRYEDGAELMFSTAARGTPNGTVALEVLLDDKVIWNRDLATNFEFGAHDSWRLPLPAATGAQTLTLRAPLPAAGAKKSLGLVHLLKPVISQPSLLAETAQKSDIVLFLADTFRADNLAKSGGNPAIAPHINAFVDQSVYFPSAWSPSSWTLPSQSSMLTGLSPMRHGAVIDLLTLDDRLVTLPELLSRAGYRTVAVTEGGFMVPAFGLDQGFETFLVGAPLDIETTLEHVRQVLGEDDGRPLFLFVQTFRAHSDYIATDTALAKLPELFGEQPDREVWNFANLMDEVIERHGDGAFSSDNANGKLSPEVIADPNIDKLHRLYQGGSYDTSAGFGSFLTLLDEAGLGNVPTIFTSDHGEAFGEHQITGHANNCFDETLRIPMAIRAPGVVPRSSKAPVTLLDLGPTICELADIGVPSLWEGRSLVSLLKSDADADLDRRLVSFECPSNTDILPAEFAVHQGRYKLIGSLDSEGLVMESTLVGYDLVADPKEANPITGSTPWMADLTEGLTEELAAMQVRLYPPQQANLTEEAAKRLAKMGYLD
ncbi:MAG: hypothetical protein ACI9D0_000575 [Bacteroidia bacterium]|jgi:hypothetical protein